MREPVLTRLLDQWRDTATKLRAYGAESQAATVERCAEELESTLHARAEAPLTLQQAAAIGGYSVDHLARLVRTGKLRNAGRAGAPRIARRDVPVKPDWVAPTRPSRDVSRTQIVRSAINAGAE